MPRYKQILGIIRRTDMGVWPFQVAGSDATLTVRAEGFSGNDPSSGVYVIGRLYDGDDPVAANATVTGTVPAGQTIILTNPPQNTVPSSPLTAVLDQPLGFGNTPVVFPSRWAAGERRFQVDGRTQIRNVTWALEESGLGVPPERSRQAAQALSGLSVTVSFPSSSGVAPKNTTISDPGDFTERLLLEAADFIGLPGSAPVSAAHETTLPAFLGATPLAGFGNETKFYEMSIDATIPTGYALFTFNAVLPHNIEPGASIGYGGETIGTKIWADLLDFASTSQIVSDAANQGSRLQILESSIWSLDRSHIITYSDLLIDDQGRIWDIDGIEDDVGDRTLRTINCSRAV